jgi:hypothetical protein
MQGRLSANAAPDSAMKTVAVVENNFIPDLQFCSSKKTATAAHAIFQAAAASA